MAHIDVRDLGRVREIAGVLTRHGFGGLLQAAGWDQYADVAEIDDDGSWAVRTREVLVELGPTFVKLGQTLSVRPDMVPQALITELQKLQDDVPPVGWDEAQEVLLSELGCPLDQVFEEVEETSVASASIAQVHLARLVGGEQVAIKIQRPGIQQTIRSDLHILHSLATLLDGRLTLPGVYTPVAIVRELERAILQELDFQQEARNAARFRECFAQDDWVVVPRIHARWTSSRLLVMERIVGVPLSQVADDDGRLRPTLHHLVDATVAQIFEHGFFHADPHPGNLLLTEDGKLAFLDFGLCGSLTADMRDTLVTVIVSLVFQDAETLALCIYHAGGLEGRVDLKAFRGEIERMMMKYHGASLRDLSTQASLVEFIQVASAFQIKLVPEYALLARASSIVDGILRSRAPDSDPVELIRPHAKRLMTERMAPERVSAEMMKMLVQAQGGFKQLPTQLNQLLLDIDRGQLRFITQDPESDLLREEIRNAALRMSLALCAMALLVSGSVLVTTWDPRPLDVPLTFVAGVIALGVAVAMWVGLVTHILLGNQLRPEAWRRRLAAVVRFFAGSRS
ncbi:MAG: AarF/ABC1/UbiB kinase family protein [Proteobacteria bacterium]|nr:AarF/ABC1/UbiB kinase family protein [Pseudomonadota bacterium]MCP4917983.1 AarF/ABC1/UbiB kinase family protein [Pseudomonadota bacterium]